MTLINGNRHQLDIYSIKNKKQILKIKKKGDFWITHFDQGCLSNDGNEIILMFSDG